MFFIADERFLQVEAALLEQNLVVNPDCHGADLALVQGALVEDGHLEELLVCQGENVFLLPAGVFVAVFVGLGPFDVGPAFDLDEGALIFIRV